MASAFNLVKLIVGLLLVVVLGGTAVNVFYVTNLVQEKQHANFKAHVEPFDSDDVREILARGWEMNPQIDGIPIASGKSEKCLQIFKKKPRRPHKDASHSIKQQHSRLYQRWKENKNRECYKKARK